MVAYEETGIIAPMIIVKNLQVGYKGRSVVHDVDFSAVAGEITAIIGPNGSGKSTLLRAMSGELAYQGSIKINDSEVCGAKASDLADWRGVLSQFNAVTFPFTVHEIVTLGAKINDTKRKGIGGDALKHVGLAGFGSRLYHELSGGEQQRVHFARVLCQIWEPIKLNIPRWLFLDEPVSSLDIQHQLAIMNIAREFADGGGGVIAVLHDLNLTAIYADQLIVLKTGRKIATGKVKDVIQDEILNEAFDCRFRVDKIPKGNQKFVLPQTIEPQTIEPQAIE